MQIFSNNVECMQESCTGSVVTNINLKFLLKVNTKPDRKWHSSIWTRPELKWTKIKQYFNIRKITDNIGYLFYHFLYKNMHSLIFKNVFFYLKNWANLKHIKSIGPTTKKYSINRTWIEPGVQDSGIIWLSNSCGTLIHKYKHIVKFV